MGPFYPEDRKRLNIIEHLEELRKRILFCLVFIAIASAVSFFFGERIMSLVLRPSRDLVDEFIFISPTEAFLAFLKVAILSGFVLSFPFLLFQAWKFLSPAFKPEVRKRIFFWLFFSLFLFFAGLSFSYFIAFPAAMKFLMGFAGGIAVPKISIGKYISFFGALMLIGGGIFEIPIGIGLVTDLGIIRTEYLRKKRPYAFLLILAIAAVITPTQDIVNMLIFALPMMLLFETGIVLGRILEKKKSR